MPAAQEHRICFREPVESRCGPLPLQIQHSRFYGSSGFRELRIQGSGSLELREFRVQGSGSLGFRVQGVDG